MNPFYGYLTITGISRDDPKMTHPGNGHDGLLTRKINGRYADLPNWGADLIPTGGAAIGRPEVQSETAEKYLWQACHEHP